MATEALSIAIIVLQIVNFIIMYIAIRQGHKLEKFWERYREEYSLKKEKKKS